MGWPWLLPVFALWVGYAFLMRGRVYGRRNLYATASRRVRAVAMLAALLGSLVLLVAGFFLLSWLSPQELTAAGLCVAALMGFAFVHLQMVATALTLSLSLERETAQCRTTSETLVEPDQGEFSR